MMKKLLSFMVLCYLSTSLLAQVCTPNPIYTTPGVYPDSATGMDTAWVGQPYALTVTNVVPVDTCVVIIFPPCTTLSFDSVHVTSFTGLPPNFTYACAPANCNYLGGTSGCLIITSTVNPVIADTGRYNLLIDLEAFVGGTGIANPFTVDYYYIDVLPNPSGIEEQVQQINHVANHPNPFSDQTDIGYALEVGASVHFEVTNLLGEVIFDEEVQGVAGRNVITFNANNINPGIYIYSLRSGRARITRKMLILK